MLCTHLLSELKEVNPTPWGLPEEERMERGSEGAYSRRKSEAFIYLFPAPIGWWNCPTPLHSWFPLLAAEQLPVVWEKALSQGIHSICYKCKRIGRRSHR